MKQECGYEPILVDKNAQLRYLGGKHVEVPALFFIRTPKACYQGVYKEMPALQP